MDARAVSGTSSLEVWFDHDVDSKFSFKSSFIKGKVSHAMIVIRIVALIGNVSSEKMLNQCSKIHIGLRHLFLSMHSSHLGTVKTCHLSNLKWFHRQSPCI